MKRNVKRSQRAASSIIGAVLFLALIVLMVAFMQEFFYTASKMSEADNERNQEQVIITAAFLNNSNHLMVNITNRGATAANIVRLWIENQTDNTNNLYDPVNNGTSVLGKFDDNVTRSTFRQSSNGTSLHIDPGSSVDYLTNRTLTPGNDYSIRVVTDRGNEASYNILHSVKASIIINAPSSNLIGKNVTVLMYITNNDTSNNNLYNLIPRLTVTPPSSLDLLEGPYPEMVSLLPVGQTAYFRYVYQVTGSGLTIRLNGSYVDAPQGCYNNFTIFASSLDLGGQLTSMPIFRFDSMGSIPALLDPSSKSMTYWGVSFVNPYNRSVYVYSAAVIAASSPIFQGGASGNLTGINPSTGWVLRSSSGYAGVFWESGVAGPIVIRPYSAYNFTFLVKVQAPAGGVIETPVYIEAISSEGKYVKVMTTSVDTTYPSMNLYYTRLPNNPTSDFQYTYIDTPAYTEQTFNVTVLNSGENPLTSRANLLILVPAGWTNISVPENQPGWGTASINKLDDTSNIISVTSTNTNIQGGQAYVFKFSAVTPAVSEITLYNIATSLYYPDFSPSITAAYCALAVQVVPQPGSY